MDTEAKFLRLLDVERQRAQRSGRSFVLLQVQIGGSQTQKVAEELLGRIRTELRETDWVAWREGQRSVAAVCTELGATDPAAAAEAIRHRLAAQLANVAGWDSVQLSVEAIPAVGVEVAGGERQGAEAVLAF